MAAVDEGPLAAWRVGSAGYDVQVRNAEKKPVSFTQKGEALFASGVGLDVCELKPNESIEEAIPVAELFDIRAGGQYTALVSLPLVGEVDAVLTAAPIKLKGGGDRH